MPDVVVIGAGVIGLSCAVRLQQDGHRVTIVAKDFPIPFETADPIALINYASPWAGAHNRWVLPTNSSEEREHAMALETFRHMDKTSRLHPEAGITFMKGIEYFEDPPQVQRDLTEERALELGIEEFRILKETLPDQVTFGYEYRTWCVNPMVYCMYLLRNFSTCGGKLKPMVLKDPREIFAVADFASVKAVINCSGIGFGDSAVFPTRGQTCLVSNPCPATITRQNANGSWTFCVPRNFGGGTIIGGTKDADDWNPEPSPDTRQLLLDNFTATYPAIARDGLTVLRDIVGRRPTRKGGPRLGIEYVERRRCVIHAYGLGGRGYELSWGIAEEVAKLLEKELSIPKL